MKYIRTKDRLYLDAGINNLGWRMVLCGRMKNVGQLEPQTKIIREADTIDELLDGDVLFENGKLRKIHSKKEGFGIKEYGNTANRTIRGFIETNKGLIYVAETNEKGEFELL